MCLYAVDRVGEDYKKIDNRTCQERLHWTWVRRTGVKELGDWGIGARGLGTRV